MATINLRLARETKQEDQDGVQESLYGKRNAPP
jgi:hypothetical protein